MFGIIFGLSKIIRIENICTNIFITTPKNAFHFKNISGEAGSILSIPHFSVNREETQPPKIFSESSCVFRLREKSAPLPKTFLRDSLYFVNIYYEAVYWSNDVAT